MGQLNEQQQGIRRRPRGERGRLRPFIRSATEEASHKGAGQCAPHVGTTSQDQIKPSMTSGIKISTYSALLIRPYYAAGSPLLRELYALGQAIGLLAESFQKLATPWRRPGDALASRFIAVHAVLSDGHGNTASHLFPLEPVQSAITTKMLEAHKHRRTVLKSQGYNTGGRWWPSASQGQGKGGAQFEKGKKAMEKAAARAKQRWQLASQGRCQQLEREQD